MRRRRLDAFGCLLFSSALITTGIACADTIHLVNGERLEGEVVRQDAHTVVVHVAGGTLEIRRTEILEIEHERPGRTLRKQAAELLRLGDLETAVQFLQRALDGGDRDAAPALAAALTKLAEEQRREGELDNAERTLESAREALRHYRTNALARRRTEAIEQFTALLEQQRTHARTLAERGRNNLAQKHWEAARTWLAAAARLDRALVASLTPLRARAALEAGRALLESGRLTRAGTRFEEALRHDPSLYPQLAPALCTIAAHDAAKRLQLGQPLAAETILRSQTEAFGDQPLAWLYLGLVLEHRGKTKEASRSYRRALSLAGHRLAPRVSHERLRNEALSRLAPLPIDPSLFERPAEPEAIAGELARLKALARTPLFEVHAPTNELAARVAERAERAARTVLAWADTSAPTEPIAIYVLPDAASFARVTHQQVHVRGLTRIERIRGGRPLKTVIFTHVGAPALFEEVLPHEAVHALGPGREAVLPLWLEEGLAQASVPPERDHAITRLRQGGKNLHVDLTELLAVRAYPDDAALRRRFYDEAAALSAFLAETRGGYARLVERARRHGSSAESLLVEGYGFRSVGACERALQRWIARQ